MKQVKSVLIILILIFSLTQCFPWGEKIHYEATYAGCNLLSEYFSEEFKQYITFISNNGSLPDVWKSYYNRPGYGRDEGPNHFCDYDYIIRLKRGDLDKPFDEITKIYSQDELRKGGTVIWAIEEYSQLLRRALESSDYYSAFIYMAVLAHYIEDIHQPFHATENYDGQLTGNTGIHLRYEVHMINRFWKPESIKIDKDIEPINLNEVRSFTIGILEDSLSKVDSVLEADRKARKIDPKYSTEYYKELWKETEELTVSRINLSALNYSRLIYSIWLEAGKPEFPKQFELSKFAQTEVERPQFFSTTIQISENEEKAIRRTLLYSVLVVVIFYIGIIALKNH